jgi:hypothetical protein
MSQAGPEIGGLMVEVQDRTKESFQRLATAELPALYWLARRLVRDGAEDLVQERCCAPTGPLGRCGRTRRPGRGSNASW